MNNVEQEELEVRLKDVFSKAHQADFEVVEKETR